MGAGTAAKNYDGSNDNAKLASNLTGAADGKEITIHFRVKMNGGDGSTQLFLDTDGLTIRVARLSSNLIRFVLENTSGTQIVNIDTSSTLTTADGWGIPVLCACNAATGVAYVYFGDTQEASKTDVADNNIDWTPGAWYFAARSPDEALKADACFSEIWVDDSFIDPTVEANRRKFFDASGNPEELGTNGENPTGSSPLIYAPDGDPSDNKGTGGNFTITGALTDCADTPGVVATRRIFNIS